MPASLAFYRDLLGFEIVGASRPDRNLDWVLLRLNGTELMLNTAYESHERPPSPDAARIASHGDTTLFFGCPDVDGAYTVRRAKELAVQEPVTREYGMRQPYVTDPDGYSLCFQWPAA